MSDYRLVVGEGSPERALVSMHASGLPLMHASGLPLIHACQYVYLRQFPCDLRSC